MNRLEFRSAIAVPIRQLVKYVRKMKVKNGSLLIFKEGVVTSEALKELARVLPQNGMKDVLLLIVKDVNDIANLDEAAMNKYGWFKINQVMNTLKVAESKSDEK